MQTTKRRMKKTYELVKAKIVCSENLGKPTIYLSVHRADLTNLLLESGTQPEGMFTIVLRAYGVEY